MSVQCGKQQLVVLLMLNRLGLSLEAAANNLRCFETTKTALRTKGVFVTRIQSVTRCDAGQAQGFHHVRRHTKCIALQLQKLI